MKLLEGDDKSTSIVCITNFRMKILKLYSIYKKTVIYKHNQPQEVSLSRELNIEGIKTVQHPRHPRLN